MHDNPPLKCVGYGWNLKDLRHARYALTKAVRHIATSDADFHDTSSLPADWAAANILVDLLVECAQLFIELRVSTPE